MDSLNTLDTLELKAFIPSQDFERSQRFYQDLGFTLAWATADLAEFHHGSTRFLLQNFYQKDLAENLTMHLLVVNVDAWWHHIQQKNILEKYAVKLTAPEQRPWGMRDFVLSDPSGVLWRIAQVI